MQFNISEKTVKRSSRIREAFREPAVGASRRRIGFELASELPAEHPFSGFIGWDGCRPLSCGRIFMYP